MAGEVTPLEVARSLELLINRVGAVRWDELRLFENVTEEAMGLLVARGLAEYEDRPHRWRVSTAGLVAYDRAMEAAGRALLDGS